MIGGGDIKEGGCLFGGRVIFIGRRKARKVGDEEGEIKRVNIRVHRRVWEGNEGK